MNDSVEIIKGSLFDSEDKYIVHQCNCVTKRAAHLSLDVFTRYPYSDVYKERKGIMYDHIDSPGEIIVRGNGEDERYIINLFGQYYPGKIKYPNSALDGEKARKDYFFSGLCKIAKIDKLESVSFPWGIGCGAAGGNWDFYHNLICKFAYHVKEKAKVTIYRL